MSTLPNPLLTAAVPSLGTNIAMPGAVPSMGTPVLPSVSLAPPPPPTQTQTDIAEYNRQKNTGSGVSQIQNPLLRGIARAGDIAASVFAPKPAQFIPGTTLHHQLTMGQAAQNVATDQAQEQATTAQQDSAAQVKQREALAEQEQAKAAALADPHKAVDPSKTVQTDDGVYQLNPDTGRYDVRVGDRVEKPKSPEQSAYDAALAQTGDPMKAFTAVKQASNTKDATLQQQFLDGYKKAHPGASDTDAIAATIRATSTEPKLTVINAAAADRAAAKNVGLDTSDPAMQASVNAVANGSLKLADVFGRGATTAQKAQFAAAVKQVNPNYNSGDHDIENKVRQYMTSGQGGATLTAGTTLNHHLDLYDKAVDAVHNGDIKVLNHIGNEMGIQLGNDAQTNLALIRQGVAMEAARYWTGGVPGEAEINQFNQNLSGDGSPKAMHGGANTVRFMAKGKLQGLQGQAEAGATGQANFAGAGGASGASSGMAVSLKDAMGLPQFKGKSQSEVTAAIKAAGHEVRP